ncbi:AraC family ligand binding domain-containing protein [Brevibacillus sp. SIMBA_040]|uniref:AraC family ligand binding domain-containing protein n=1 Tax=unclassified Brevibacillus TaxID=2684853 RepID=UPI0039789DF1
MQSYREVDRYTILIALDGQGHLHVEDAECYIKREGCWVIQPGQNHWIRSDRHVLEYFWMTFRMLHLTSMENGESSEPFPCTGELTCRRSVPVLHVHAFVSLARVGARLCVF